MFSQRAVNEPDMSMGSTVSLSVLAAVATAIGCRTSSPLPTGCASIGCATFTSPSGGLAGPAGGQPPAASDAVNRRKRVRSTCTSWTYSATRPRPQWQARSTRKLRALVSPAWLQIEPQFLAVDEAIYGAKLQLLAV